METLLKEREKEYGQLNQLLPLPSLSSENEPTLKDLVHSLNELKQRIEILENKDKEIPKL
jgi:hypothetical protein